VDKGADTGAASPAAPSVLASGVAKDVNQIIPMIEDANDPSNPNALKNIQVQPSTVNVLVRGYWNEGDDGGGLFYSSTEPLAADGGTIIAAPGGYWVRIFSGPLHFLGVGDATLVCNRTSTADGDVLLAIQGDFADVVIENIRFESSVVGAKAATTAVQAWTAVPDDQPVGSFVGLTVRGCIFGNFSEAIVLNGTQDTLVTQCRWRYDNGNACRAPGATYPAVGVHCVAGTKQTRIVDNYWFCMAGSDGFEDIARNC
jgi:hypothetical protein